MIKAINNYLIRHDLDGKGVSEPRPMTQIKKNHKKIIPNEKYDVRRHNTDDKPEVIEAYIITYQHQKNPYIVEILKQDTCPFGKDCKYFCGACSGDICIHRNDIFWSW